MESENKNVETSGITTSKKPEEKIVNLFEDMNVHEHNAESYQKATQKQEDNTSK